MPDIVDGAALVEILENVAVKLEVNKDYLCELDSEVGDGDHGVSMTIGMRAARRSLGELRDPTSFAPSPRRLPTRWARRLARFTRRLLTLLLTQ